MQFVSKHWRKYLRVSIQIQTAFKWQSLESSVQKDYKQKLGKMETDSTEEAFQLSFKILSVMGFWLEDYDRFYKKVLFVMWQFFVMIISLGFLIIGLLTEKSASSFAGLRGQLRELD